MDNTTPIVVHAKMKPSGDFALAESQYIAVTPEKRLDEFLEALETESEGLAGRVTQNETDISSNASGIAGLDTRVTALEESGGGGGTTNYNELSNIPQINGVSLKGNLNALKYKEVA